MKAKAPQAPLLRSPKSGGTVLDWAFEFGREDELLKSIQIERKRVVRRRRRARAAAALAVVLVASGFWAIPTLRSTATLSSATARRPTFHLPDGSHLELNARSLAKTDFRYGRRQVTLSEGEAYFEVAKDPAHPFRVVTPEGTVIVTGTHFDVRIADAKLEVTLLEGSVSLKTADHAVTLAPSQQFGSEMPAVRTLTPAELARVTAWREGEFAFDDLTLAEAMERLAHYHNVSITVDPSLAQLRPGGSYLIDDLPALMKVLESALGVRMIPTGEGGYRVLPK
jgi:transmembrane sensor